MLLRITNYSTTVTEAMEICFILHTRHASWLSFFGDSPDFFQGQKRQYLFTNFDKIFW